VQSGQHGDAQAHQALYPEKESKRGAEREREKGPTLGEGASSAFLLVKLIIKIESKQFCRRERKLRVRICTYYDSHSGPR